MDGNMRQTPFTGLIRRVQKLSRTIDGLVIQILIDDEDAIIKLNQAQLYQGQRSTGKRITPRYSQVTIRYKRQVGQPADRVTLQDKGDFYDSMHVEFDSDSFQIVATDPKTGKLIAKYGAEILGLSKDSIEVLRQIIRPKLIRAVRQRLLG